MGLYGGFVSEQSELHMPSGQLSKNAMLLYGRLARGEKPTGDDKPALDELVDWGFVVFDDEHPDDPVPLDPQEAGRRRLEADLRQAADRVARMQAMPALVDELRVDFERNCWRSGGSEFLAERHLVNARLDDVIGQARQELLTAQPGGPRTPEELARSVDRDSAGLARGVRMRTLYRDTVRDHPITAEAARVMSAKGRAYRTLVGPFHRLIVIDRREAFISDYMGAPDHSAWHVTDRALVAFVVQVFEETWLRAQVWHGELRAGRTTETSSAADGSGAVGVRTNAVQRAILRDMAAGMQQRITASRIGISLRTLTDEIAVLKEMWGASTLHELTYQWALSPDHDVDDQIDGISSGRPAA